MEERNWKYEYVVENKIFGKEWKKKKKSVKQCKMESSIDNVFDNIAENPYGLCCCESVNILVKVALKSLLVDRQRIPSRVICRQKINSLWKVVLRVEIDLIVFREKFR